MCPTYCINAVDCKMQDLAQSFIYLHEKGYYSLKTFDISYPLSKVGLARRSFVPAWKRLNFTANFRFCDIPKVWDRQRYPKILALTPTYSYSQFSFGSVWRMCLMWWSGLCHTISFSCTLVRCPFILLSYLSRQQDQFPGSWMAHKMQDSHHKERWAGGKPRDWWSIYTGRLETFTSAYTLEKEDKNWHKYAIEMPNTLSHGSALSDHLLSLRNGLIYMALRHLHCKNGDMTWTRYILEDMD